MESRAGQQAEPSPCAVSYELQGEPAGASESEGSRLAEEAVCGGSGANGIWGSRFTTIRVRHISYLLSSCQLDLRGEG